LKTRASKLSNKVEKRGKEVEKIKTSADDSLGDAKLYMEDIMRMTYTILLFELFC
jgi:hypothetical protein